MGRREERSVDRKVPIRRVGVEHRLPVFGHAPTDICLHTQNPGSPWPNL